MTTKQDTLPAFTEMSNPTSFDVVSGFAATGRYTAIERGPFSSLDEAREACREVAAKYGDDMPNCFGVWIVHTDADGNERIIG